MKALDGNTLIAVPDLPELGVRWPTVAPPAPLGSSDRPAVTQLFANPNINGFRHRGTDIGEVTGSDTPACEDGVVDVTWRDAYGSEYGIHVILNHGGYVDATGRSYLIKSLYAHLDSIMVMTGQRVQRGQLIGRSGNTGLSTGPHLHWEIQRWSGWYIIKLDPMEFIREVNELPIMTEDAQRDYMLLLPHLKALAAVAREGGLTATEDTPAPNDPESRAFRRLGRLTAAAQLSEAEIRALPDGPVKALLLDLINLGVD